MSDPKQKQHGDELELDAEAVADLELEEQNEEQVRGGCPTTSCWHSQPASA